MQRIDRGLGPVRLMILDALFILPKACTFLFIGNIFPFSAEIGFPFRRFILYIRDSSGYLETSLFPFRIPRKRESSGYKLRFTIVPSWPQPNSSADS